MPKRSLFQKFGHVCEIRKHTVPKHEMGKHSKYDTYFKDTYGKARDLILINETNRRGYNFLRSQKRIEAERKKQLMYTFTIHPFSDFQAYWEVFMAVIILAQISSVVLYLAVSNMATANDFIRMKYFRTIKYIFDIISGLDILLSFCTGYCNNIYSKVIIEPKRIISHYLASGFIMDLLCSIPLDVIIHRHEDYLKDRGMTQDMIFCLKFVSLVKLCRYPNVVVAFRHLFEYCGASYFVYMLFMVPLSFIMYIHVFSCIVMTWMLFQNPWSYKNAGSLMMLMNYGPNIDSFLDMYGIFFYTTCMMVMNAGYRLSSFTNASLMFTVNIWVASRIIFIITLSYFMEVYSVHYSSQHKYLEIINGIKDCMRHKHVPEFLQNRILNYYDVKYQNFYFNEKEILHTVSAQLRQEMVMNTCRKLVESVTFFKTLPMSLLVRIVSCLRYDIYLTNDVITKAGTLGDSMFFISHGTVAIYAANGQEICHLRDGDHFGEISLVMKDANRIATVVATEVCEMFRLEKKDFMRAILPYPDLMDKISNIATDRIERTDVVNEANKFFSKTRKSNVITM